MTLEEIQEILQLDVNDAKNFDRLKSVILDLNLNGPTNVPKSAWFSFTQIGSSDPEVVELSNNTGRAISFERTIAGSYNITFSGTVIPTNMLGINGPSIIFGENGQRTIKYFATTNMLTMYCSLDIDNLEAVQIQILIFEQL